MRLPELTIEMGKIPGDLIEYCIGVADTLNLHDERSKTQEHAFYNAVYRYDATTDFFTPNNYFGSLIPPVDRLKEQLKPLYNWLIETHFNNHKIFRSQVLLSPVNAQVLPHIDPRLYHELSHRVHCVLKTNNRCRNFHFIPENNYDIVYFHMRQGYLFDLDNIVPHAAFNYGAEDRLHIILDVMHNEYVEKYKDLWIKDTNHTPTRIMNQYNYHVSKITERYGDEDALRLIYQASLG
jgi:hypothetical protein